MSRGPVEKPMYCPALGGFTICNGGSIAEARVPQRFPEIDPNLRIGEIELDADPIERLLGRRIAGHEERELLMPLAGARDFLLKDIFHRGCDSFHHIPRLLN